MLLIRIATKSDQKAIENILKELDQVVPLQKFDNFWVAETKGEVLGVARLEDYGDYLFLSCIGVKGKNQNQGIASELLNKLLASAKKTIYLYTVIPAFFEKYGFKVIPTPSGLPSKENYKCQECIPEKCRVMVKLPDAS